MTILEPVRHSVVVPVGVDEAFRVYVEQLGDWWPHEHTISDEPKATSRMDPGVGGKVVETGVEGTECQLGTVLVWEPPVRLVVAWQITPRWRPEPDLSKSSEYEVTFTPLDDERTLVEVEHRHLERHGEGGDGMRAAVDSPGGWPQVLASLAAHTATT